MIQLGILTCPKCDKANSFWFVTGIFTCEKCDSRFFTSTFNFPFFELTIYSINSRINPFKIINVIFCIEI